MNKQEMIELLKTDVNKFNVERLDGLIDLRNVNLHGADLRNADLHGADLHGANLDFSVFTLWCGSFDMKVDIRLVYQLCYHICRLKIINKNGTESKMGKVIQSILKPYANKFHRVTECGKIK